jgi:hypothetical protein
MLSSSRTEYTGEVFANDDLSGTLTTLTVWFRCDLRNDGFSIYAAQSVSDLPEESSGSATEFYFAADLSYRQLRAVILTASFWPPSIGS